MVESDVMFPRIHHPEPIKRTQFAGGDILALLGASVEQQNAINAIAHELALALSAMEGVKKVQYRGASTLVCEKDGMRFRVKIEADR